MENAFYGYLLKKCFKLQNHSHFITAADTAEPETSLERILLVREHFYNILVSQDEHKEDTKTPIVISHSDAIHAM